MRIRAAEREARRRRFAGAWWLLLSLLGAGPPASWAAGVDFRRDIQPLLVKHCLDCHGPAKQKSGLRLDRKEAAFRGGDSGEPGIVAGNSKQSRLFRLVERPRQRPDAAQGRAVVPGPDRPDQALDRQRGRLARVRDGFLDNTPHHARSLERRPRFLVLPAPTTRDATRGSRWGVEPESHRPVHPPRSRGQGPRARAGRRCTDAGPADLL